MAQDKSSDQITLFLKENDSLASPKEKVEHALQFMKRCLNDSQTPFFKGFWSGKDRAFELLKTLSSEASLWARYKELNEEFAKVKALVTEQSKFTLEQIELALQALKTRIEELDTVSHEIGEKNGLSKEEAAQLGALEARARASKGCVDQLVSLRNEVLKSPGIFKSKSKLLDDLNTLIDQLIPIRKEAQNSLSDALLAIVRALEERHTGSSNKAAKPPYARGLFNQIRSLQALLKELTLHPKAFQEARKLLSKLWEASKSSEDVFKAGLAQKRKAEEALIAQVRSRLEELKGSLEKLSIDQARDQSRILKQQVKRFGLPPKDAQALMGEIDALLEPLFEKETAERRRTVDALNRDVEEKKAGVRALEALLQTAESVEDAEQLRSQLEQADQLLSGLELNLEQRVHLEPIYKALKDKLFKLSHLEKLPTLSKASPEHEDLIRASINHLVEQKSEALAALDELKKAASSASHDFHQALLNHQLVEMEGKRLDSILKTLQSLEDELETV